MKRILKEGKNCWQIRKAKKVAFLVDAAACFDGFARAAARAKGVDFDCGVGHRQQDPAIP